MVLVEGRPMVSQFGGTVFQVCLTRRLSQAGATGVDKVARGVAARTGSIVNWWKRMTKASPGAKKARDADRACRNTEKCLESRVFIIYLWRSELPVS